MRRLTTALALLAAAPVAAHAQQAQQTQPAQPAQAPTQAAAAWPAAKPADVATLDAILAALYAAISGPAGQPRDFDRMKSLFHPTARMEPIQTRRDNGQVVVAVLSPDDYVRRSGETLTKFGFNEVEIARRTERFGNLVHVWSTYTGRFASPDAPMKDEMRGVNSIQLAWDGTRFWILNIAWDAERPGLTLPAEYLKSR